MILLDTLSMTPTKRRPVWIMRQAGRYLSSFRKLREKYSFDQMSGDIELATKTTLLPLEQYDLDAAIVFSDILLPLKAMGAHVEFGPQGPVVGAPKNSKELNQLKTSFDPKESSRVILGTLKEVRKAVKPAKAVLGFSGAPFTLLTYLLEGKLTKDLSVMKKWMAEQPKLVHEWLDHLAKAMGVYLDAQAQSGADAVQLFDTWASFLSPEDFESFALPYARKALSAVTVPSIYYVNGVSGVIQQAAAVGSQALSVDWRMNIAEARRLLSPVTAIQGNLDPYHLLLPKDQIRERVFKMCNAYGTGPGHIVNLGHGIVPEIPEAGVQAFIEATHEWSAHSLFRG